MIRYEVVWLESADDEPADLWMAAVDRHAITAAAFEIDRQLEVDASTRGEALSEGLRALNVPPVRIIFSVNDDNQVVEIAVVRAI